MRRPKSRSWLAAIVVLASTAAPPAGGRAADEASHAAITRDACSRLVAHQPSADVAYQPGVDVYGNRVAPADDPGNVTLPSMSEIVVDLDLDLQTLLGIVPPPGLDPDVELGKLVVRDGRLYLNGRPLGDEATANVAAKCRALLAGEN